MGWIGDFFQNLFAVVLGFLSNLGGYLINGIITVLKTLFRPVLILVALVFYFIQKLAELVISIFAVLLGIGKLLYAFVMGLFATLAGFTWTPTTPDHGTWSSAIGEVFAGLSFYQLDSLAYLLLFAIWIMTAVAAIRILSSNSGGRGDE